MVVLVEEAPKLLNCIPIDSTSFGSYSPYQNLLISSTRWVRVIYALSARYLRVVCALSARYLRVVCALSTRCMRFV